MTTDPRDLRRDESERRWPSLPAQGTSFIVVAIVVSALLHWVSYLPIDYYLGPDYQSRLRIEKKAPIHVKFVTKPIENTPEKKEDEDETLKNRLVEVPLTPTERPKDARFQGAQDHTTDRETKVAESKTRDHLADAGKRGDGTSPQVAAGGGARETQRSEAFEAPNTDGTVAMQRERREAQARSRYENMLPNKQELLGQITAGYQDYIDEKLEESDTIDVNTTDYRYMGYVTLMRKAIYQVWNYPADAIRRGMQGEGIIFFRIERTGVVERIQILKSSGYDTLDRAAVEAIRLAQPFAPIPKNVSKDHLAMKWGFRYILTSYMPGH